MHHFVCKKKERKKERKQDSIKKIDRRYKKEKKENDKKMRKQKYIHMTREPMTVLFSLSQYRMIKKMFNP